MKRAVQWKENAYDSRKSSGEMTKAPIVQDIVLQETVKKLSICVRMTFLVEIGSTFAMVVHLKRSVSSQQKTKMVKFKSNI